MKELCICMSPQNGRRGNSAKYIRTADPVGIDRNLRQNTIFQYSKHKYIHDFLPLPTGKAVPMYLTLFPRLPFFRLIYIQLLHLWNLLRLLSILFRYFKFQLGSFTTYNLKDCDISFTVMRQKLTLNWQCLTDKVTECWAETHYSGIMVFRIKMTASIGRAGHIALWNH